MQREGAQGLHRGILQVGSRKPHWSENPQKGRRRGKPQPQSMGENWAEEEACVCDVTRKSSITTIQFSSVTQSCPTLCGPMDCSTPGFPVHHQLPEVFISTQSVMPSKLLILCCLLPLLPSIFPSIRFFSNESVLHIRWPKYWSFSFSLSPSNKYSELISFRRDWLDLLAVQGTLKSLLQLHSSKAWILWHSAFFIVQLSHPYVTTRKTIAFTRWAFVGKVMSLLFNMLSMLVITFLPGTNYHNDIYFYILSFTCIISCICSHALLTVPFFSWAHEY